MKIVAMSDTHGKHKSFENDLISFSNENPDSMIIHSGDACYEGNKFEGEEFLDWFGKLPFKTKIFIPGNHDISFEHSYYRLDYLEMEEIAKRNNVKILINQFEKINGFNILASSHIPFLKNWAFFSEDEQRERFFEYIEQNADIVISHTPPYGIGDEAPRGCGKFEHIGCKFLKRYIDRNKPNIVINGHIHEGYGMKVINNTRVFNCSNLDGHYMSFNPITIIEI